MNSKQLYKKTILLLEHEGNIKEYALEKAKERGYRILMISNTYFDLFDKYIDSADILITDVFDMGKLIIDVSCFLANRNVSVDAVGTFRENLVIQAADLAEAFNVIGVGSGAARRSSQNKLLMRQSLRNAGFKNQPDFTVANLYDPNIHNVIKKFSKPCVVKPLYGTASLGVKKITDNDTIIDDLNYVKNSLASTNRGAFKKFQGEIIIEQYVPGRVISIDGIVKNEEVNIIGSIDFIMGPEPYFVQESSFIPAKLSVEEKDICENLTRRIIKILGFKTAGFHCELRLENGHAQLLEIAARLPGAGIYSTYNKVLDIDLIGLMFDAWLGIDIPNIYNVHKINFHHNVQIVDMHSKKLIDISDIQITKNKLNIDYIKQIAQKGDNISCDPAHPTIVYEYSISGTDYEHLNFLAQKVQDDMTYRIE